MKKILSKIYYEAISCSKRYNSTNEIRCIKRLLADDIGADRDKLLAYKVTCSEMSNPDEVSLLVSLLALIISAMALISAPDNKCSLAFLAIAVLVVTLAIAKTSMLDMPRYRKMLLILEEIEKEMDSGEVSGCKKSNIYP